MSIKVSNINQADPGAVAVRGVETKGTRESGASAFRRTMTDMTDEMREARLNEMREAIEEQGKRLGDRADVKEFEKYRRLVREFLDEIVSNGYTFSREDAYASRGRHRYIATVKVVNEKLDELGKAVMQEQADKIDLVHKIDDIRGLLLDMML
ncbi:MAG: YaaR family protein [Oscillospiraceae bacterium]|nr:YaaR family protein [Oscillospiraceae bacterium]